MRAIPIAVTILVLISGSAGAFGHALCGERNVVISSLEKNYSEVPVSMGLESTGGVIEVLAAPEGSFTILITRPNGLSCIMVSGENWETVPMRQVGPKT